MEEKKETVRYSIGLDLGTASIGWAVVDDNDKLIRKSGKNLWGVRLFDEAKPAKERRTFRRQRRTINKRSWRLHLLKQELKDYVLKEDKDFFKKLKESQKHPSERNNGDKYFLFNEDNYDDKKYYKEFPTIYHLRKTLKDEAEVKKLVNRGVYHRLLYLALSDILKCRGNFLTQGEVDGNGKNEKEIIKMVSDLFLDDDIEFKIEQEDVKKWVENELGVKDHEFKTNPSTNDIIKAFRGKKFNLNSFFQSGEDEKLEKLEISFSDEEWEETEGLDPEKLNLAERLKEIHDAIKLFKLLKNHSSFSDAKIAQYNKHKEDLKELKAAFKQLGNKEYNAFFKNKVKEEPKNNDAEETSNKKPKEKPTYSSYVGVGSKKKATKEDLVKEIIKLFSGKEDLLFSVKGYNKETKDFKDDFLPIPNGRDNSIIPYQLHKNEANDILKNATITETNKEHIIKLIEFKVPYYVGPLGKAGIQSQNYWLDKKEDIKITPYNFDDIIDTEKTAEKFIKRMLRNCTYLHSEPSMRKDTILYQTYVFYNAINKIKINDVYLEPWQKEKLFEFLILGDKITKNLIKKRYLELGIGDDASITGIPDDGKTPLNISLKAVKSFRDIFPLLQKDDKLYQNFYDDVVEELSLFDKDDLELRRKRLEFLIKSNSTITLDEDQKVKLIEIGKSDTGNLSRKFLNGIKLFYDDANPNGETVIEILKKSNLNLMEILYYNSKSDNLPLNLQIIDNENNEGENANLQDSDELNEYLEKRYVPTLVRRGIIQANLVVKEIVKIMGCNPERIAIEFTRENDPKNKGKETTSRLREIQNLYKKIKEDLPFEIIFSDKKKENTFSMDGKKYEDNLLKQKKVFLYLLQKGKDLYTGESINFNDIINDNHKYDIDHIWPQSKIKDDSLRNNLVLTEKTVNEEKTNIYPLPEKFRQVKLWEKLRKDGFMNEEKFNRLKRTEELKYSELKDFEDRQKTTLDWTNRETARVLWNNYSSNKESTNKTEHQLINEFIIFSKSHHVSHFRNIDFNHLQNENNEEAKEKEPLKFIKFREMNNFHHAHDAYLNIVIGRLIKEKFGMRHIKAGESLNWENLIEKDLKKNIDYFKKIFYYKDILVTKKTHIDNLGEFWDQMLAKGKKDLIPKKKEFKDTKKYGGYNKAKTAFFTVIKTKDDSLVPKEMKIIPVQTYKCSSFYDYDKKTEKHKFNLEKFNKYIDKEYKGFEITKELKKNPIIKIGEKVMLDGMFLKINAKTKNDINYHNTTEFVFTKSVQIYLRKLIKLYKEIQKKPNREELLRKSIKDGIHLNEENNCTVYKEIRSSFKIH